MDEKNIIHLAGSGDPDAFCRLYEQYKDRLYRYAVYRLGNRQDAEDAVSECVMSAFRQIGQLRDEAAFPAWIFRILSGTCSRLIAQQAADRGNRYMEMPDCGNDAAAGRARTVGAGMQAADRQAELSQWNDPAELVAARLDLYRALEQLTEEEREIVLLSVVAGFSSKEIAQMTGGRPGTVRSRQSRSLSKMRAYLGGKA